MLQVHFPAFPASYGVPVGFVVGITLRFQVFFQCLWKEHPDAHCWMSLSTDEMIPPNMYSINGKGVPTARTFNSETVAPTRKRHQHDKTKVFFIVMKPKSSQRSFLACYFVNTSRHKINCIASTKMPSTAIRGRAGTRSALLRRQRATMEVFRRRLQRRGIPPDSRKTLLPSESASTLGTATAKCFGMWDALDRQGHRMCDQSQPNAPSTSRLDLNSSPHSNHG